MADEKWNLNTTTALTAESGTPAGLVNPPRTAEQHVADRPADYGEQRVPPKPAWYTDAAGNAHSHGVAEPHKVLLFWRSEVGQRDPSPEGSYYKGVRGLQSVGITGHRITVNGVGDVHHPGAETSATISGYWDRTDAANPIWKKIEPGITYTFTVAAHNAQDEYGPASDPLTITTPPIGWDAAHLTLPPRPPNDVDFAGPLPVITSATGGGIELRWTRVPYATTYEIFDNTAQDTSEGMDTGRIGLNESDVKLGEVPQPAEGTTTVTFTTPAYTTPRRRFALKVRAVRTDAYGTAASAFSPPLRGMIPDATRAPGQPGAPTFTTAPTSNGQLALTLAPPPIGTVNGPPEWYALYDGPRKVTVVEAPLGTAPHVTLQYAAGQAYDFTVIAGNSQGTSPASAALSGTVPTA